jgi:hypothetical protein
LTKKTVHSKRNPITPARRLESTEGPSIILSKKLNILKTIVMITDKAENESSFFEPFGLSSLGTLVILSFRGETESKSTSPDTSVVEEDGDPPLDIDNSLSESVSYDNSESLGSSVATILFLGVMRNSCTTESITTDFLRCCLGLGSKDSVGISGVVEEASWLVIFLKQ